MIEKHTHDGINSDRLDPKEFRGFPITTTAPTFDALEGTIVLANLSGTYYIYTYINGGWRRVQVS